MLGIVNCFVETQNCQEREQGLREALRGNTRVKGIYVVNVSTDAEEAKLAAERLVQEHPEINVLVGFNEPLAVGVAEAVDELGLTGQVRAISFDTNMRCIELMQTGAVGALIVQNPYAMGYLGVEKAWQALQGMKFDKHELIDTMTQIVTKRTCSRWKARRHCFPSAEKQRAEARKEMAQFLCMSHKNKAKFLEGSKNSRKKCGFLTGTFRNICYNTDTERERSRI